MWLAIQSTLVFAALSEFLGQTCSLLSFCQGGKVKSCQILLDWVKSCAGGLSDLCTHDRCLAMLLCCGSPIAAHCYQPLHVIKAAIEKKFITQQLPSLQFRHVEQQRGDYN